MTDIDLDPGSDRFYTIVERVTTQEIPLQTSYGEQYTIRRFSHPNQKATLTTTEHQHRKLDLTYTYRGLIEGTDILDNSGVQLTLSVWGRS